MASSRFIFEQSLWISLQDLKRLNLLNEGEYRDVQLKISRRNGISENWGVFRIITCTEARDSYLEIDFSINGKACTQRFNLVKKRNDPPKGYRWFIVCPFTGKNCIKLFFHEGQFKSRTAIKNGTYLIHTFRFRYKRSRIVKIEREEKDKRHIANMKKPYSKPFYNGTVTKRNRKAVMARRRLNNGFDR